MNGSNRFACSIDVDRRTCRLDVSVADLFGIILWVIRRRSNVNGSGDDVRGRGGGIDRHWGHFNHLAFQIILGIGMRFFEQRHDAHLTGNPKTLDEETNRENVVQKDDTEFSDRKVAEETSSEENIVECDRAGKERSQVEAIRDAVSRRVGEES